MEGLKYGRKVILALIDIVLINLSYIAALYFRFPNGVPYDVLVSYENNFIIITAIYIICFYFFKLYDNLWSYASIDEFMLAIGGCIIANLISTLYTAVVGTRLPYGVSILAGILNILLIGGFRMSFRITDRMKSKGKVNDNCLQRVMVIGAGKAGVIIIKEMKQHPEMKYDPVAVIDDNRAKAKTKICGVKVVGNRQQIVKTAKDMDIDIILIAIPSINKRDKKELLDICKETGCKLKLIPGIYEIIDDRVSLKEIRDVDVEDLLGREPVNLDMEGIESYIKNKIVMVTGGGGSIGSELCRQIARFLPKRLIILDVYENCTYDIQNELKFKYPNLNLKVIIANITDRERLEKVFKEDNIDVIFHAAAHKHVPLMEGNPQEAIKNNIFGTLNTVECADKYGVKRFVMISTDKAVNPTNIMGATKRTCEMIIQAMDKVSKTEFVAVRFGNVLGSNGSVIPLFKKQIVHGGPVTVTNKYITRFFMTIPEAAQLVMQAGAFAKGGEIFVLDMGEPVKIYDLACELIKLSGFEPHKDIKIEITGLRPGEKLYEEVLMDEEGLEKTSHSKIFVGKPIFDDLEELKNKLKNVKDNIESMSTEEVMKQVKIIVPTYKMPAEYEVAAEIEKVKR